MNGKHVMHSVAGLMALVFSLVGLYAGDNIGAYDVVMIALWWGIWGKS